MKIVLSIRDFADTSGVERVVANLASAFCALGHEVEIACYYTNHHNKVSTFPFDSRVKVSYLYPHPDNHANDKGLRRVLWKWFRHIVVNLAINKKYKDADIFIESDFFLLFPYIKRRNMKYIRIIHVEVAKWKKKNNLFDKVVVLSTSEYEKWKPVAKNIAKIFNFIPMPFDTLTTTNPYENSSNLIKAKEQLLCANAAANNVSFEADSLLRIIAVGQMQSPQKGFPRMAKAYSMIAKQFPHCRLEITGRGHDQDPMQSVVRDLCMEEYITLNPFTTNVEFVYLRGDIYAMTSYYEGLPMALIEAMSYGLPIVAYNIATLRDCFSNEYEMVDGMQIHKNGILVPEDNEELFCKALSMLICDEVMRQEMGYQSLILARDRFSQAVIMQEWEALLRDLRSNS